MTDINLKTLTPNTSLPTTGFLFGADSQASTNPSVYSTQTVATTLLGSTSLTGDTLTASAPVLNLAQTWNNGAVTFTGVKLNVTDTTSGSSSLLMDLQVGGSSKMSVSKGGALTLNGFPFARDNGSGQFIISSNGADALYVSANGTRVASGAYFGFSNAGINNPDLYLLRRGAANIQLGLADAASPVAQTFSVQSVVAGTSNTAGANFTITGSQGTGTGAGGSIIFQVAPAGTTGTAQNALVAALTIGSDKNIIQGGNGYNWYYNASESQAFSIQPNNANVGFSINVNGVRVCSSTPYYGFGASVSSQAGDLFLSRAGAGVVQVGTTSNNASGTLKAAVVGTTTAYTVATLPTGFQGARAFVTDATLPTYLGTLTGGGAVICPVFYNGTAWVSA